MDEWVLKLEQVLYRLADGDVSDEDVQYIVDNIPRVQDELKQRLQSFVDEPHERKNIQYAIAAIGMYKLSKMIR
jgi:hypothetical protein